MLQRLANGLNLAFDMAGSGRPVVWLHAFPYDRRMWRPEFAHRPGDYQYLAPDLRGFGESDMFRNGEAPSVELMADDVALLLDSWDISEPVAVAGLSMGGYVALAFARRHPGRVAALILADTRAEPDSDEARAARDQQIQALKRQTAVELFETLRPKQFAANTADRQPGVIAEAKAIAEGQTAEGLRAALTALRDRPDARSGLGEIQLPTLVIVGEEDTATPPDAAQALANGISGAQLVKVPQAGHLSNLEQPYTFNRAVAGFLLRHFPPSRVAAH